MIDRELPRRIVLAGMAAMPLSLVLGRSFRPASAAQAEATPTEGSDLSVTITASDFAFSVPAEVPAGFVTITLVNDGPADHSAQILRLNDGVLLDDVKAALERSEADLVPLVSLVGGPGHIRPGHRQSVVQELTPGSHLLLCFVRGEHGLPHAVRGMAQPFEVVDHDESGTAPTAEREVILRDFGFDGLPDVIVGRHTWKVTNAGPEPHELGFRALPPGVTAEMALAMLGEEAEGSPAATPAAGVKLLSAGGIQAMSAGLSGWLDVDLEPGDYVAVCMVPGLAHGGTFHASLGMAQAFTVTAE